MSNQQNDHFNETIEEHKPLYATMSIRRDLLAKIKDTMLTQPRNVTISDYLEKLIDQDIN